MKDGSVRTNPGVNNPDILEPIGEIDESVNVIRFNRADDDIVLVNFATHPDTIGGNVISADWPGFVRTTLERALDNTKCKVLPMNELCVTTFTRKRIGNDMQSYLVKPCPGCGGMGHVPDDLFVITRLRTAILDCFAQGNVTAMVDLNGYIMKKIFAEEFFAIEAKNRWKDKQIYFIPHKTFKEDHFLVRGEKTTELELPENAHPLH
jgi:hypothetical protein